MIEPKRRDVMIPARLRARVAYDPELRCENCEELIGRERQENALHIGRYPQYCDDVCAKRAASRRWYERRGRTQRLFKKRLAAQRRARRKRKNSQS